MLLAVNVGNTSVAYGLFDEGALLRHDRVPHESASALPNRIGPLPITRIVLATVAPRRSDRLIPLLASAYGTPVLVAGRDLPFTLPIHCDAPQAVGADRLLNALAAHARTHAATIVADVGTAVTVDLVAADGAFCGGAIAPGPGTMLRALAAFTELLPEVEPDVPPSPIGRCTRDAMRAGAWYGVVGMVRELAARIARTLPEAPPLLVTGGAGADVAAALDCAALYIPELTLEGIAILSRAG